MKVKKKKPGRKPVYNYKGRVESSIITIRLPGYILQKLDSMISQGIFPNRSRGIAHLILEAGEDLNKKIASLEREKELLQQENEALRKRIEMIVGEKEELVKQLEQLKQEIERMKTETEEVKEAAQEVPLQELDVNRLPELAEEYNKISRILEKGGNFVVFVDGEVVKRSVVEKQLEDVRGKINAVLEFAGLPKAEVWRLIRGGRIEALKKLLERDDRG